MSKQILSTRFVIPFLPLLAVAVLFSFTSVSVNAQEPSTLLIYALAFDNEPTTFGALGRHYTQTVETVIETTTSSADHVTVALLVDVNENIYPFQDHILIVESGVATKIVASPTVSGTLETTLPFEYNTVDGALLGGFVRWAREQYPTQNSFFSYVGHGTFAPPLKEATDVLEGSTHSFVPADEQIFPDPLPFIIHPLPFIIHPLPFIIHPLPNYTDAHTQSGESSPGLITPHIFREALQLATDDGANPLDVVDLFHCFSGSAEELYELTNPDGQQYAETLIGSANYHYFFPDMIGRAITALKQSSDSPATAIAEQYNTALGEEDNITFTGFNSVNPRTLVVVDSDKMVRLKTEIDMLATHLVDAMDADPTTVDKIEAAHQTADVYYDTSFCDGTFTLNESDGLVDVGAFSYRLSREFGDDEAIRAAALAVNSAAEQAVITHEYGNGLPWFGDEGNPEWEFKRNGAAGLSIMGDFTGGENEDGNRVLSWQTTYYTHTIDQPLQFTRPISPGLSSWADMFYNYWDIRVSNGVSITTQACLPSFLEPAIPFGEPTLYWTGDVDAAVSLAVTPTDFNSDSDIDLVIDKVNGDSSLRYFLDQVDGVLTERELLPDYEPPVEIDAAVIDALAHVTQIEQGDVNGDGLPNVVTVEQGSADDVVVVYTQLETGEYVEPNIVQVVPNPLEETLLTVADLEGNGVSAMIVVDNDAAVLTVHAADSVQRIALAAVARDVITGDFNNDGYGDVVTLHDQFIAYYRYQNDGTLADYRLLYLPLHYGEMQTLVAADMTGEGGDDLLISGTQGEMFVFPQRNTNVEMSTALFSPIALAAGTTTLTVTHTPYRVVLLTLILALTSWQCVPSRNRVLR